MIFHFGNEQVHLCFEATGRQTGECVSARYTRTHKPKSKEDFRAELSEIIPGKKAQRLKKKNWFQNCAVAEMEDSAGFNPDDVTQHSAAITGCASNFINIITYIQKLSIMSNGTSLKHLFAADYSIITPVIQM